MRLLNENLNHVINDELLNENSPSPMWVNYMDAFSQFMQLGSKRLERNAVYEEMDKYPEITMALDIISTEMFSFDPETASPFNVDTNGKIPDKVVSDLLFKFTESLKLKETLPYAVRDSLKYGDSFYFVVKKQQQIVGLRKINPSDIDFIEYDEIGIEPMNYYMKASKIDGGKNSGYLAFLKHQNLQKATEAQLVALLGNKGEDYYIIPSNLMIRFMNKGQNSQFFPFGESYLESLFPLWKKVTLLEDSLIIYRIVRAPERRAFYIDVGKAPAKIADKVVAQTKEEIKRRRSAASQESGELGITSSFNPLSMQEDYFFAQRADGRGSRVETLAGASNLGEIADVNYFYKKLVNSLRVPMSYFNSESQPTFNDGKVGSALAEEARFGKWLSSIRDQYLSYFKVTFLAFVASRGIVLKEEDLKFEWRESINVAQNQELDQLTQRQAVLTGFPPEQFAPTYMQRRILGWSEEEIQENITQLKKWAKINQDLTGGSGEGV